MRQPYAIVSIFIFLFSSFAMPMVSEAEFVTMAKVDLDGKPGDELLRTESAGLSTFIRIYEAIPKSMFFKPAAEFEVPGILVQVPEVTDRTNDGVADVYFATGSDVGIIYFDNVEQRYLRKNEVDMLSGEYMPASVDVLKQSMAMRDEESDLLLSLAKETPARARPLKQAGFEEAPIAANKQVATL